MKFMMLLIGVMLLEGIELHRHRDRHGHQRENTDPMLEIDEIRETDKMGEFDEICEFDETIEMRKGQNEIRYGKVMPKPGIRKNKLVAKYGTNFRYMGTVKNGLDRVMVVTLIPIPRFENIKVKPINGRCAKALDKDKKDDRYLIMADTQASKAVKEWCARATPYIEYLQQQEKYYIEKVHELLCEDLYSALPELKLMSAPLIRKDRLRRGLGTLILTAIPGLITLAVESVSSWIKGKQQR